MRKHSKKIIIGAVILAVLAAAFLWGGNAPGLRGGNLQGENIAIKYPAITRAPEAAAKPQQTGRPTASPTVSQTAEATGKPTEEPTKAPADAPEIKKPDEPATEENRPAGRDNQPMTPDEKVEVAGQMADTAVAVEAGSESYSRLQGMDIDAESGTDEYRTEPVPEGQPVPVEPQDAVITDTAYTCTLSVRCDAILENIAWLDPEKIELVPADGVILPETEVTFYEGESVFNLLVREMKRNKIHLEFTNTPIYNSAYIEGIHNLYAYDCGELSGWMYKVNDWFPNYGCSRYALQPGDRVEWVYTCDLGVDAGGYYAAAGE